MSAVELPPFTIALYENELDHDPHRETFSWIDLAALLTEHERTDCDPCPGGKQCKAKCGNAWSPGVPREGTTRLNANVEFVSLLSYDFDHLTMVEADGVFDRLAGLQLVAHSSHSHLHGLPENKRTGEPARPPEDDYCFRVVLPLLRPLAPAEYQKVRQAFIEKYGLRWTRPQQPWQKKPEAAGADNARKDLSGLYFLPSAPKGAPEVIAHQQDGEVSSIDELLAAKLAVHVAVASVAESTPDPEPSGPVDMDSLRKVLRAYSPRGRPEDENEVIPKKELVRRVRVGEPLVNASEPNQRDHSSNRIGFLIGRNFPTQFTKESLLELVRPSVMGMPVYDDDDPVDDSIDARFAKVVRGWENGRAAYDAQQKEKAERKEVREAQRQMMRARFKGRASMSGAKSVEVDVEDEEGEGDAEGDGEDDKSWQVDLVRGPAEDDGKEGPLLRAEANANLILEHSPEWRGILKFNMVTKKISAEGAPLRPHEMVGSDLTTGINYWFQRSEDWRLILKTHEIQNAIYHAARANAFDPLKDYLESLHWDGTARDDTWLETYCGVELKDPSGNDITEHIRRIARRWLISAVARAYEPGCQVDTVLMLEGGQGIKKSTLIRTLAVNPEWFTDSPISIAEKDGKMLAAKKWIVELAELSALRASDVEAQKAFFSTRVDEFRPPYAPAIEEFLRRCVYVGSTNDDKYLLDPTGNRRYWVAKCTAFQIRKAKRERDQVWAEAVHHYKAGFTCAECRDGDEDRCPRHRWWLTKDENEVSERVNATRLRSGYTDTIRDWILSAAPEDRPTELTIHMIAAEALELSPEKFGSQNTAIGLALRSLGCGDRKQRRVPGGWEGYYTLPDPLRYAPKRVSKKKGKGVEGKGNLYPVPDPSK